MHITRKLLLIVTIFYFNFGLSFGQTLLDNFNRTNNTTVGGGWTEAGTSNAAAQEINSNQLVIDNNSTSGRDYVYQSVSGYTTDGISNNSGTMTWAFNMRQNRSNPSGFNSGNYGVAFVIGGTTSDFNAGTGYAVVLGQSGLTDNLRLVHYSGGLDGNGNLTDIIAGSTDFGNEYLSIRVTYDPSTNNWSLYASSNSSSFPTSNPASVTTQEGSTTANSTYTGTGYNLQYVGCYYNHSSASGNDSYFDDVYIPGGACSTPTNPTNVPTCLGVRDGRLIVDWTSPSCFDSVIVVVSTSNITGTPSGYSSAYTVGDFGGAGSTLNSGEYIVYVGTGVIDTITNLSNNTSYNIKLFASKGSSWSSGTSQVSGTPREPSILGVGDLVFTGYDSWVLGANGSDMFTITTLVDLNPGTTFDLFNATYETGGQPAANERTNRWYRASTYPNNNITLMKLSLDACAVLPAGSNICIISPAGSNVYSSEVYTSGGTFNDIVSSELYNSDSGEFTAYTHVNIASSAPDAMFLAQLDSAVFVDDGADDYNLVYGRLLSAIQDGGTWYDINDDLSSVSGNNIRISRIHPDLECYSFQGSTSIPGGNGVAYSFNFGNNTLLSGSQNEILRRLNNTSNWWEPSSVSLNDDIGCGTSDSVFSVSGSSVPGQWNGTLNTNWFDCHNWDNLQVPDSSIDVTIPSSASDDADIDATAAYSDQFNDTARCKTLSITSTGNDDLIIDGNRNNILIVYGDVTIDGGADADLDMSDGNDATDDGTLVVYGNWNNNVDETNFKQGQSKVIFAGNGNKTLDITGTTQAEIFYDFSVDSAASLTLNDSIRVEHDLEIYKGTLSSNNKNISVWDDWENSGAFTHGVDTVFFEGSADVQDIRGDSVTRFNNVVIATDASEKTELEQNIIVDGYLRIASGSEFDMRSSGTGYTADIYGNLYDENSTGSGISGADGRVNFVGTSSAQNIVKSGTDPVEISKVEVNNSNGVVIHTGSLDIADSLILTNGILTATTTNELRLLNGAGVDGGSNASHVDSVMTHVIDGTSEKVLPLGDGTLYHGVYINPSATATDREYQAIYRSQGYNNGANSTSAYMASQSPTMDHVSYVEWWDISCNNSTDDAAVGLHYNTNSIVSSSSGDWANLRVAHWDGSEWEYADNAPTHSGNASTGYVKDAIAFSTFSPFTIGTTTVNNPLPAEVVTFTAECQGQQLNIQWTTASESNNDYFLLQKLNAEQEFETIAQIDGAGHSNELKDYSFIDHNVGRTNIYQLVQHDFDGTETIINTLAKASCWSATQNFMVYENSNGTINIEISDSKQANHDFELYDLSGKLLIKTSFEGNTATINKGNLANGIYIVVLDEQASKKLIVR